MTPSTDHKQSPMMVQWQTCKAQAKDAILFFRLGDFFECFYEDALTMSKELNVTLTQRQGIPMSGIPAHTLEGYLEKLVALGHLVAIADQIEDSRSAKGLVQRAITRIVSPATHLSSSLLRDKRNNFFASITQINSIFGLARIDLSTGEMAVAEMDDSRNLIDELARLAPSELLISEKLYKHLKSVIDPLQHYFSFRINLKEEGFFDHRTSYNWLTKQFGLHSLDGFGLRGIVSGINAAGALLIYLTGERAQNISHVQKISRDNQTTSMAIDHITERHLEILSTTGSGKRLSLLTLLDQTLTPMGGRLFRSWLSHPLLDVEEIHRRQEGVEELLLTNPHLEDALSPIRDLERLIMRIKTAHASPRDLTDLAYSLQPLPLLKEKISALQAPLFQELLPRLADLSPLVRTIVSLLVDNPPLRLTEGGLFREGAIPELDALRLLKENSQNWLANYQVKLRDDLDIKTLKVSFTRAFGYYIEVSRGQSHKMPAGFERRQTLVNAERYISPELKEYEYTILHAEEKMQLIEQEAFHKLRDEVATHFTAIQMSASTIAIIDCIHSLAEVARTRGYVRPQIDKSSLLEIEEGRHPVIEALLLPSTFIPNSTLLDASSNALLLITGPNMAGKSTYIRQVALLTIMAQIGSFIPAKSAHIGVIDKIFSRIGASDDLARGQSTFMVEMVETANILHNAGPGSLVILDEIGRGTSTYDGLSIAWAVAEHLLKESKAKTLFATHYFELTKLQEEHPSVVNYRVSVHEDQERIIFLHKIIKGNADKSYGIHVARLAGLPLPVITRAKRLLAELEGEKPLPKRKSSAPKQEQFLLFGAPKEKPSIEDQLQGLDLNSLTPIEALQKLVKWKDDLRS